MAEASINAITESTALNSAGSIPYPMHDQAASHPRLSLLKRRYRLRRALGDHLAPLATLAAGQVVQALLAVDGLRSLLDNLLTLGQDELDVRGVGHCDQSASVPRLPTTEL